ncbi:MAG TPA: hypothetical protein VF625_07965, partial [Longimicrobium sp.]
MIIRYPSVVDGGLTGERAHLSRNENISGQAKRVCVDAYHTQIENNMERNVSQASWSPVLPILATGGAAPQPTGG